MKQIVLVLLVCMCVYACKPSQKSAIKKANDSFNKFVKNKDEKIMFEKGIDFFAEGNQPSNWNIQMDYDDTVRFIADDGLSLKFAYNQLKKDIYIDRSIFTTKLKAGNISITILEKDCTVPTKKEVFKKEVQFNFNDNIYTGCGKYLADNTLNNKWILEKIGSTIINAKEYNRIPLFELDIEKKRLTGNDGCNTIGGNIEVQGSRIKFGNMMGTKMGCAKKSIENIISNLINNNIASYYFKEEKLYLYLIDDSLLVFKKG
jgi:heat shock protein HslJ